MFGSSIFKKIEKNDIDGVKLLLKKSTKALNLKDAIDGKTRKRTVIAKLWLKLAQILMYCLGGTRQP